MPKSISSYQPAEDEDELAGDHRTLYKQSGLEEGLLAVITTAFYGTIGAGIIDCGMRLAAFFTTGPFSAWLFPQIEYPLVAAGLILGSVLLYVIKTRLKAETAEFLAKAGQALTVELPTAYYKIETLQKDLLTSQEAKTQAQQEVTRLVIDLRASQQVAEQQQRQLVELHLQLKKLEDLKHNLNNQLEEMKIGLSEANKRYGQARQQTLLADLKANEYAAKAVEQAISALNRTAGTLSAMEKQLKKELDANSHDQQAGESSPSSHQTGLKKNYS